MAGLKFLAFGIDGLASSMFEAARSAGAIPNLAAFADRHSVLTTRCTWPPHTASGWTTLFSGRLPGQHGHLQFWDCQDPDMRLSITQRGAAEVPLLWDAMNARGWRVGMINVPMTHPADPAIAGFQFTWPLSNTLRYGWPPGVMSTIANAGGLLRSDLSTMYRGERNYWRQALGYVAARTRGARALVCEYDVDALFIVHAELDRVCHHFWPAIDMADPAHAASAPAERVAAIAVLQAIDQSFADLQPDLADDAVVLIASDHGFGPAGPFFAIERELERAGLLSFADDAQVDPLRTTVYLSAPGSFGLNVNLRGRQRNGVVDPADSQSVLTDLIARILSLTDSDGELIFQGAVPAEKCYFGHPKAPDLLLVPRNPGLTLLRGKVETSASGVNGQHRIEGFAMLGGVNERLPDNAFVALESLAPAIADHFDIDLGLADPTRLDCCPLDALNQAGLAPGAWSGRSDQSQFCTASLPLAEIVNAPLLNAAESEVTAEARLQAMGYL